MKPPAKPPGEPIVQLSRTGPAVGGARRVGPLRAEFDRRHCIRLPGLLDPQSFQYIQCQFGEAVFADRVHDRIAIELCMRDNPALNLLNFLVNDSRLFRVIRDLTGCGRIGSFVGRVYRMASGAGHYDSWHTDCIHHRMIGMSVNLSPTKYDGGTFQLRERASERILVEAPNTGPGDAIVFRIATHIEHRVTDVAGDTPKTAYAGWFVSEPDFMDLLTSRRDKSESIATAE